MWLRVAIQVCWHPKSNLTAIHPSESEVNHGVFADDCYVEFPALVEDAMEGVFVCHGGCKKEERAPNPADII
jgi:hypothetical protein